MGSNREAGLIDRLARLPGHLRWRWHGSPPPGPVTAASWAATYGQMVPLRRRRVGVRVVVAGESDLTAALATDDSRRVVVIAQGDRLLPTAERWFGSLDPGVDLVYSDHVIRGASGVTPVLKPAWSPRRQAADSYLGTTIALSGDLARAVAADAPADLFDVIGSACRQADTVAHLPVPLWETDIDRRTMSMGAAPRLDSVPTVTVVVPTRDRPDLLREVVPGLLERTEGAAIHLVLVDNGSTDPEALALLDGWSRSSDVTVVRVDEPFNFSRLINAGVRAGPPSEFVLLLNNDVEVVDGTWLSRLCAWMGDPTVAAVGPRLLFPDGTIQHAGMVMGLGGIVGHYALGEEQVPPLGPPDVAREVSCLTGACLLVRTDAFERVGGLDESLAIDFQDVDLCLRLGLGGGVLVYEPTATLVHHQMASRDPAEAGNPATVARVREKWGRRLDVPDPFWNPHLDLVPPGGHLAEIPMTRRARRTRVAPRITGG